MNSETLEIYERVLSTTFYNGLDAAFTGSIINKNRIAQAFQTAKIAARVASNRAEASHCNDPRLADLSNASASETLEA